MYEKVVELLKEINESHPTLYRYALRPKKQLSIQDVIQ